MLPSPIGMALRPRQCRSLALGKQGLGVDDEGPLVGVAHEQAAASVDVRQPVDVAVDNVRAPDGFARGGVEDGHGAGRAGSSEHQYPTYCPPSGCQVPQGPRNVLPPGARVGRRRFSGGGVDEPDPAGAAVVEPAIGHLLPVRGEVGLREHLGVADLGRPLQVRVLHRPVPGAQHRVAAALVDQVTVRAEADAPRSGGVPPFQRPAGGGVPDDELTVVGVRPHQRAVGREPDVADLVPVSTQRVDRRPGGGTHQERLPTA